MTCKSLIPGNLSAHPSLSQFREVGGSSSPCPSVHPRKCLSNSVSMLSGTSVSLANPNQGILPTPKDVM